MGIDVMRLRRAEGGGISIFKDLMANRKIRRGFAPDFLKTSLQAMAASGPKAGPLENAPYVPDSTELTMLFKAAFDRMISFSASTTRKNMNPPAISHGQTDRGTASVPKRD